MHTHSAVGTAGKNPAEVATAINAKPAPASFDASGVTIELHTANSEQRRANSYNVAGLIEGSDPMRKAETIVFSGHFDHDGPVPRGFITAPTITARAPSA
jgi:hypothetical protein